MDEKRICPEHGVECKKIGEVFGMEIWECPVHEGWNLLDSNKPFFNDPILRLALDRQAALQRDVKMLLEARLAALKGMKARGE